MPGICWCEVQGAQLHQGDYLPGIPVPLYPAPFKGELVEGAQVDAHTEVQTRDVIVVNQTCDLVNGKLRFVALCPADTIAEIETEQPSLAKAWKEIMRGRREGYHLLAPCDDQEVYRAALLVDFHEIISLPTGFVEQHAYDCGTRLRLISPYLEHFSQAFARFYMRVALPEEAVKVPSGA